MTTSHWISKARERGAGRRIDLGMKHTGGGEDADGICICITSLMITSTEMMNDGTYRIFLPVEAILASGTPFE